MVDQHDLEDLQAVFKEKQDSGVSMKPRGELSYSEGLKLGLIGSTQIKETGTNYEVYVEGDLDLSGSLTWTINGFVVVAGDVINEDYIGDMDLSGEGTIQGVLYGKGGFKLSGDITINGCVMVGGQGENGSTELETTLNGNIEINYNPEYVNAINDMIQPLATFTIVEWKEI